MDIDRRRALRYAGMGVFSFTVAGRQILLTPREAQSQNIPLRTLTQPEAVALGALGDTLLPGATDAGIVQFVDHQISVDAAECLLIIRMLDAPPPFAAFYQRGLAALDKATASKYGKPFAELAETDRIDTVRGLLTNSLAGWAGVPSPRFYYGVRSDAIDVVYGTVEGFEKLKIPYMPHIEPTRKW